MKLAALMLIIIASSEVGLMSELRKIYQVKNGTGVISTALFMFFFNIFAVAGGLVLAEPISITTSGVMYATIFSVASLVTAILCLIGTGWGNISIIITCASLGKLVLPTIFGIIVLPEDNIITAYKVLGFLFAAITLVLNFVPEKSAEKNGNAFKFKLACIIVFFTQGSALIIYNIVNRMNIAGDGFVTMYMAISVLLMLLAIVIAYFRNQSVFKKEIKGTMTAKSILIIIGYAILAFTSDKLSLTCSGMVPLIFQAPVEFCVPIVVIAIIDFIIYRERLSKRQYIQLLTAFLSCGCFMI